MTQHVLGLIERLARGLFGLPRRDKQILQALADSLAAVLALGLAYWMNGVPIGTLAVAEAAVLAPVLVGALIAVGAYRAIVRFLSIGLSPLVLAGALFTTGVLVLMHLLLRGQVAASLILDFAFLLLILVSVPRQLLRWVYEGMERERSEPVVIFGAGSAGRQLAQSLGARYRLLGFVDHDPALHGAHILGAPVRSPQDMNYWVERGARHVFLALPQLSVGRRREILSELEPLPLAVQTIPALEDIVTGRARVGELRDVAVEDLLGRDAVDANPGLIDRDIQGKVVMVTGAGGSIGSEICRQVIQHRPRRLVLYENSEPALYTIHQELLETLTHRRLNVPMVAVLGTVCDSERLGSTLRAHQVDTVYHAAAYKHVPLVEHNAMAALRNNVLGTWITAKAAIEARVGSFVLISTDKAVRPTNVMGATKRLAELGVQALAEMPGGTRLCMVRFGNVLGSSGSVVPLFRRQIEAGGPVTVTHPEIIRYFMTIPEAAQLVIQAGAMATHGDVFVLDMGEPVNIRALAERMIRLSGLRPKTPENPDGDIEITLTGLRPGEKLYEELLVGGEAIATPHPRISRIEEPSMTRDDYEALLDQLLKAMGEGDVAAFQGLLRTAPLQYQPRDDSASDVALAPHSDKVVRGVFGHSAS